MKRENVICVIVVLAIMIICIVASCSAIIHTTKQYGVVHVCDSYGNCFDYEMDSYRLDRVGGAYIETKEYGSMYLPQGTYALFEKDCPLCARFYHMPETEE